MNTKLNLAGKWDFCLDGEKKGSREHFENLEYEDTIMLPSSTAYEKKGPSNRARETYFLTEVYKFEGYAWFKKTVKLPFAGSEDLEGKHFFLTLERSRITTVFVDGVRVGSVESFIAKHVYDLTGYIKNPEPVITVMVSNVDYTAPGGHMTSPDTQTNWNGILGEISLEICDEVRIENATVFADAVNKKASVRLGVQCFAGGNYRLSVGGDLCILKKELFETDGDTSVWDERAYHEQGSATDMDILEGYLDIEKGAAGETQVQTTLGEGSSEIEAVLELPEDAKEWDDEEPYVYRLRAVLYSENGQIVSERYIWFGLREFKASGDHFTINGRKTFLRGRHQGMLFPLSGFAPMNVTGWLKDLKIAKDWGINHERFHTCTPPEAAFIAADLLGIYLQPEIPFWGTWAGKDDEKYAEAGPAQEFLRGEGFNILKEFAGHPSFVMMSMGNELWGDKDSLNELIGGYKKIRPDICYTQGSNNFQWVPCILPNDDFFSGVRFTRERQIRGSYAMCDAPLGRIQKGRPSTAWNYDNAIRPEPDENREDTESRTGGGTIEIQYGTGVKKVQADENTQELIPDIPVVSHEIGQYFIYPDFNEIPEYTGVCQARNLEVFQERLEDMSLSNRAKGYFESSGALAIECYKQELEAALRSSLMAGFQILDLQDFSGQGTALVGPLNALMKNKGLITPGEWRRFCSSKVVLGEFDSYVRTSGESFALGVKFAYYGKTALGEVTCRVAFKSVSDDEIVYKDERKTDLKGGNGLFTLGDFNVKVPENSSVVKYELNLCVYDKDVLLAENSYTLWAYDRVGNIKNDTDIFVVEEENGEEYSFEVTGSGKVAITTDMALTDAAVDAGKSVLFYLTPSENRSLPGAYCTDFWNYPMFRSISESMGKPIPVGTLGMLIAKDHPALADFPCETYTTPQWFEIIENSRSSLLNWLGFLPIVTVIDNCESNDNLGMIYEFLIMDGKSGPCHVVVCTSPLRRLAGEGNAPAAALERSLLNYLEKGPSKGILRTHMKQLRRLAY